MTAWPLDHRERRKSPTKEIASPTRLPSGSFHVLDGIGAAEALDEGASPLDREHLQPLRIDRQPVDERAELMRGQRQEQHQRNDEEEDEEDEDDKGCPEASDPKPLQPVGQRIEQIGKRKAGHERQEDAAEHIKQQDRRQKRDDPEPYLPLDVHRPSHLRPPCGAASLRDRPRPKPRSRLRRSTWRHRRGRRDRPRRPWSRGRGRQSRSEPRY